MKIPEIFWTLLGVSFVLLSISVLVYLMPDIHIKFK